MDAFAVSIGLGSKHSEKTKTLAIMSGIYFGLFQALMPLFGYFGSKKILIWVENYASLIGFILLLLIGMKMIYESFSKGAEADIGEITHKVMLVLAIATSIDAMAAGFTLTMLDINVFIACLLIGLATIRRQLTWPVRDN